MIISINFQLPEDLILKIIKLLKLPPKAFRSYHCRSCSRVSPRRADRASPQDVSTPRRLSRSKPIKASNCITQKAMTLKLTINPGSRAPADDLEVDYPKQAISLLKIGGKRVDFECFSKNIECLLLK